MTDHHIKKELHEYIDQADDRILKLWYGMMLIDKNDPPPEWHQQIVEDRLEKYHNHSDEVVTWEELKRQIEKLK